MALIPSGRGEGVDNGFKASLRDRDSASVATRASPSKVLMAPGSFSASLLSPEQIRQAQQVRSSVLQHRNSTGHWQTTNAPATAKLEIMRLKLERTERELTHERKLREDVEKAAQTGRESLLAHEGALSHNIDQMERNRSRLERGRPPEPAARRRERGPAAGKHRPAFGSSTPGHAGPPPTHSPEQRHQQRFRAQRPLPSSASPVSRQHASDSANGVGNGIGGSTPSSAGKGAVRQFRHARVMETEFVKLEAEVQELRSSNADATSRALHAEAELASARLECERWKRKTRALQRLATQLSRLLATHAPGAEANGASLKCAPSTEASAVDRAIDVYCAGDGSSRSLASFIDERFASVSAIIPRWADAFDELKLGSDDFAGAGPIVAEGETKVEAFRRLHAASVIDTPFRRSTGPTGPPPPPPPLPTVTSDAGVATPVPASATTLPPPPPPPPSSSELRRMAEERFNEGASALPPSRRRSLRQSPADD